MNELPVSDKFWNMLMSIATVVGVAIVLWVQSLTSANKAGETEERLKNIEQWRPTIESHISTHDLTINQLQIQNAGLVPKIDAVQKQVEDINRKLDKLK